MPHGLDPEIPAQIVRMAEQVVLPGGTTVVLDGPHASILMVALRVKSTGPVRVSLEEQDRDSWRVTGETEAAAGTTVWHFLLKQPVFRLRVDNPHQSPVTVSIDACLPCPVSQGRWS